MSDKNSASRTALMIVSLLLIGAAAWIFWPDNTIAPVAAPDESNAVPATVHTSENQDEESLKETKDKVAESGTSEKKGAVNTDFRVSGEDYASVPKGRLYTTTGVEGLIPEPQADNFKVGQKVFVYAEVRAPRREKVRFTWYDGQNEEILPSAYVDVDTNVGEVGFRIYSYRTFRTAGEYRVALFNSTGSRIGSAQFSVGM